MYKVVYYYKEMVVGKSVKEEVVEGDEFRLRRNALHYVLDIVRSDMIADEWGTEPIVGGINCYKSEKLEKGRKIMNVIVKVEKA